MPKSFNGKAIAWGMSFLWMIFISSYTANLASFLTVQLSFVMPTTEELLKDKVSCSGDGCAICQNLGGNTMEQSLDINLDDIQTLLADETDG